MVPFRTVPHIPPSLVSPTRCWGCGEHRWNFRDSCSVTSTETETLTLPSRSSEMASIKSHSPARHLTCSFFLGTETVLSHRTTQFTILVKRSEERRVGKECGYG